MKYKIEKATKENYKELILVWEKSVSATHKFLKEEDIIFFKPLIFGEYFDAVQLFIIKIDGQIGGFLGVSEDNIEMLFVDPSEFGKGIGKKLLHYAIQELKIYKVDVNEQNKQAVDFYLHMNFVTEGRSEKDGSGKPYPLLHLRFKGI